MDSVSSGPVVRTTAGEVGGVELDGVLAFLGVPYAAPPVGARRYAQAVPHDGWDGVRPCRATGANAHQGTTRDVPDPNFPLPQPQSEDCLFVNVWTSGTAEPTRPVLVYVHAGGYFLGTGNSDYLDGARFARDDVVFVTVTYRLNGLGFLHLDELFDGMRGTGNLGITDVVRALEWVQENIAAFGGDPSQVTLGGHSAGGITTAHLMASPRARGLFHRAVPISSASAHNTITSADATKVAERVLREVGVAPGDRETLMALPAHRLVIPNTVIRELYEIAGGHPLEPVADGDLLTGRAIDAIEAGAGSEVALLIGTTTEEFRVITHNWDGTLKDPPARMGVDAAGLDWMKLFAGTGRSRAEVEEVYARSLQRTGREVTDAEIFAAAAGDYVMHIPSAAVAESVSRHGGTAYVFQFGWRPPAGGGLAGSQHGNDIPFFFDRVETAEWQPMFQHAAPPELGRTYHDAVVAMVTTGNPSTPALPDWPRYDAEKRATMMFDVSSHLVEDPEGERRRLFEGTRGYRG